MVITDFAKLENENYHSYIWRMDSLIKSGKYKNWTEITPFVNKELFKDDDTQYRDESAYRKAVKYARDFYEAGVFGKEEEKDYFKQLRLERQELQKEKQKLSDERVELNRLLRTQARKESYIDMVKRVICEDVEPMDVKIHYTLFNSSTDLLCSLSDIHAGIKINTWNNVFNEDVLKQRIEKYTSDILDIRGLHQSENCYLAIGEILSGLIHNNLRLQNNMDLMEQFKYVSELISAMLVRLANNFSHVYVYTTPGNHSRITPNKEDSLDGENMDVLLPFYLKARLQNVDNVFICDNTIDPEIAMFSIRGNKVFAAHGHKDSPSNVVQNFTLIFNIKPDIVLLGHRHTNGLTTVFNTKVIQTGCVSGNDLHTLSIRKANRPEQAVSVVGENGLVCLYDIQLD